MPLGKNEGMYIQNEKTGEVNKHSNNVVIKHNLFQKGFSWLRVNIFCTEEVDSYSLIFD